MPRGNPQNLLGSNQAEAKAIARKGGIASGEARRRKKSIMESLKFFLAQKAEGYDGLSNAEVIAQAMLQKAMVGNVRASEFVRDTVGEKPGTHVDVSGTLGDVEILRIPDNGRVS